jgi:drug/metabolite transporter (DMT)-like permease
MKWVTRDYPVAQSVFMRGAFLMLPMALLAWREHRRRALRVQRWGLQGLRAALSVVSVFLFVTALGLLPLADAIAITFASPLFVTALAPLVLKEPVGWRRRIAVTIGFLGVVVMLRPGEAAFRLAALLPLAVAVCEAARDMVTRRMVLTESTVATIAVTNGIVAAVALVVSLGDWRPLDLRACMVFALGGCFMGGAQVLMMEAFRHGETVVISPFRYSSVIWAAVIGALLFGDWPDAWMLSGCLVVVASGVYILYREVRVGRRRRGG